MTYVNKATLIESGLHDDIRNEIGTSFNQARFLPYIQMHEFEALLFSDTSILVRMLNPTTRVESLRAESLHTARASVSTPEEINDHPDLAPSKRILSVKHGYRKSLLGYLIAQDIGLEIMRSQCPHFNNWVCRLEALKN
jgi:hypothetical protein